MTGAVYILDAQDAEVLAGTGPAPAVADLGSQPFFRPALSRSYVQILRRGGPSRGHHHRHAHPGPGGESLGVLAYWLELPELQAVLGRGCSRRADPRPLPDRRRPLLHYPTRSRLREPRSAGPGYGAGRRSVSRRPGEERPDRSRLSRGPGRGGLPLAARLPAVYHLQGG
jgi:hypothetical protein